MGGVVQAGLRVDLVVLVDLPRELPHQCYHVAVVHLVRQVVQTQLQDRPRIAVLRKFSVGFPERGLVLSLRLLVVELYHRLFFALAAPEVGL